MSALAWFEFSEETRLKLKALAPADWRPPEENYMPVKFNYKGGNLEEIARLMRKPGHIKRGKKW